MEEINLEELREEIDKKDRELVEILAERFALTEKVGEYKKANNMQACAEKREEQVYETREKWAKELELEPVLIKELFIMIIKEVKKNHETIKNSD